MTSFTLTAEQEAIVAFVRDRPNDSLMADARAGAAKTSTIVAASASINPMRTPTLALAFNTRIKKELEERLPSGFQVKTLNGLGHAAWGNALRRRLTVDADKMFKLTRRVAEFSSDPEGEKFASALALARAAKSGGLVPAGAPLRKVGVLPDTREMWEQIAFDKSADFSNEIMETARKIVLASIKEAYNGLIDFDDQIYMSTLFDGVFPKYHTVIVDETQDLGALNHIMLQRSVGTRLIAIGDPYQAIYAFRGADSDSMDNLSLLFDFTRLGLSQSFRVPHAVSSRQTTHVPDFSSHHTVKQGSVEIWKDTWSVDDIPSEGAILCRNNAPLFKLAFALIRKRRKVKVLGRDIGTSMAKLALKIGRGANVTSVGEDFWNACTDWEAQEMAKVRDSESKQDTIRDRAECVRVLVEASQAKTLGEASDWITDLFSDKAEGLVLSSGHRSKGLEWSWVMHLDPWRVPAKAAQIALDHGNPKPMQQERNLRYVIETRTKDILVAANLEKCKEIDE